MQVPVYRNVILLMTRILKEAKEGYATYEGPLTNKLKKLQIHQKKSAL